LRKTSTTELSGRHGLGPAKTAQLLAALEIGHRLLLTDQDILRIGTPEDAAGPLMLRMADLQQEQIRLVMLNMKNDVIGWPVVSTGGLSMVNVRMADVFREPIKHAAAGIIFAHNHPSGDPRPSPEDVNLTRELVRTGKLLSIEVVDHLVIGKGSWVSMRRLRMGFPNDG
jgi:DNA repair protein RadC